MIKTLIKNGQVTSFYYLKAFFLMILIFSLSACFEQVADVENLKVYEKDGVKFEYPGNWKVTDDTASEVLRYIFIETPGDAINVIQIYSKEDALPLNEYAEAFSQQTVENIPVGEMETQSFVTVSNSIENLDVNAIKEAFSITLLAQEIPHQRMYYALNKNQNVVFITQQTSLEFIDKIKPGFEAILKSFMLK